MMIVSMYHKLALCSALQMHSLLATSILGHSYSYHYLLAIDEQTVAQKVHQSNVKYLLSGRAKMWV